jgi:hypothetical protein
MSKAMKIAGKVRFDIGMSRIHLEGRTTVEAATIRRKELERLGTAAIAAAMRSSEAGLVCAAGMHVNTGATITIVVPSFWGAVNLTRIGHELTRLVYAELGLDESAERAQILADEESDHLWKMEWIERAPPGTVL